MLKRRNFSTSPSKEGYLTRSQISNKFGWNESTLRRYEKRQYYVPELDLRTPLLIPHKFDGMREVFYEDFQIKELNRIRELLNKR